MISAGWPGQAPDDLKDRRMGRILALSRRDAKGQRFKDAQRKDPSTFGFLLFFGIGILTVQISPLIPLLYL
jgi:hypothetical protein